MGDSLLQLLGNYTGGIAIDLTKIREINRPDFGDVTHSVVYN